MLSQPKFAAHLQSAKLKQHWRHLKGNYDLNSAYEKADRLLEQKPLLCHKHYKPTGVGIYRKKYVFLNKEGPLKIPKPAATLS
jgi:hypothetical protein